MKMVFFFSFSSQGFKNDNLKQEKIILAKIK